MLIVIFFFHWLADFVWQPDWMGKTKSKDWNVLGNHSSRIGIGSAVAGFVILAILGHIDWMGLEWFIVVNAVSHFVIDAVTSRITGHYWAQERVHAFFVTIGFDQFLHMTIAVSTLAWFLV